MDDYGLKIGRRNLAADLGAERLISAAKGLTKIVVEVKSFVGKSDVRELQQAIGQYDMYWRILAQQHPERRRFSRFLRLNSVNCFCKTGFCG